jgi:hypothetical protein
MSDKSPYLPTPLPTDGLENEDVNETVIQHPDDATTLLGRTKESVSVDEKESRRYSRTQTIIESTDGSLIRDASIEGLYACRRCDLKKLALQATAVCISCHDRLCLKRCAIICNDQWLCRRCLSLQSIAAHLREAFRWR